MGICVGGRTPGLSNTTAVNALEVSLVQGWPKSTTGIGAWDEGTAKTGREIAFELAPDVAYDCSFTVHDDQGPHAALELPLRGLRTMICFMLGTGLGRERRSSLGMMTELSLSVRASPSRYVGGADAFLPGTRVSRSAT
jgi:hypothetical protein